MRSLSRSRIFSLSNINVRVRVFEGGQRYRKKEQKTKSDRGGEVEHTPAHRKLQCERCCALSLSHTHPTASAGQQQALSLSLAFFSLLLSLFLPPFLSLFFSLALSLSIFCSLSSLSLSLPFSPFLSFSL